MGETEVWLFFKVFISTVIVVLINAIQDGDPFKWWAIALITFLFYIVLS